MSIVRQACIQGVSNYNRHGHAQNQLVETCRGGCHGPPRVTLGRKVSGAETPTKRRGAERSKDEAAASVTRSVGMRSFALPGVSSMTGVITRAACRTSRLESAY